MTTNIQKGIHDAVKWLNIVRLTKEYNPAIHILTETTEPDTNKIKHQTSAIRPNDLTSTEKKERAAVHHLNDFPYHIMSTVAKKDENETGVVILVHPDWTPRMGSIHYKEEAGRWIKQSYHGPEGVFIIYGVYGRVNPTRVIKGGNDWTVY